MRIREVATRIVTVPLREPQTWRYGRSWALTNVIVEVHTDEGPTGIGEAPGHPTVGVIDEAIKSMSALVVGEDPTQVKRLIRTIRRGGWHHYQYVGNIASAAIEAALWDIVGKVSDAPVHRLWGGVQRDAVPFYWYVPVPDRDPDDAARQAADGVAQGFTTIYIKVGFDLEHDLAITQAVRDAVGDSIAIRVDANEAWTVHEAGRAAHLYEDLNLEFLEQPIDMHDIAGLADLRRRWRVPIGANQTAWLTHNVLDILRLRAADVIVTDQHQLGGLGLFLEVAGMCEIASIPVVKHSFGDLGPTTAASLHALAGLPGPALAHQTFLPLLESDILLEPLQFEDGCLRVPSAPGLGIELDEDAVARYEALYRKHGEAAAYAPLDSPSPFVATDTSRRSSLTTHGDPTERL